MMDGQSPNPGQQGVLQRVLRHDRALVITGLLLVVVLCWVYLLGGAGTMQEMGGMLMPMSSGPWSLQHAGVMLLMWVVMMDAMMLPSAAPMILLYTTMARARHGRGERMPATGFFVLGYLAIWTGFSLVAVTLQYALEQAALLSPMMETTSVALAGGLLVAAGLYQWTPLKQTCLRGCRSPLEFVLSHWRPGLPGALRMGFVHGLYCLGCCWMLMLLLFAGGVMSMAWIAGLALFVLVEKLAPAGHWVGRAAGGVLIAWGLATLSAAA